MSLWTAFLRTVLSCRGILRCSALCLVASSLLPSATADGRSPSGAALQQASATPAPLGDLLAADATLYDVTFLDANMGWAVGDRGVVLHTTDGGRHWYRQATPVDAPLFAVHFVDAERGWIVGGQTVPYTHRTQGIVLHTLDGGRTWSQVEGHLLPRLIQVQFFDPAHGVAVGYGSAFYPSGLFITTDGGKSWQTRPSSTRSTWLAADFLDFDNGALAGDLAQRATLLAGQVQASRVASGDDRRPHAMALTDALQGWLVGERGLLVETTDGGASWHPPAQLPLPLSVMQQVDFRAVAAVGSQVWVAGEPGTHVWYSPDRGASWTSFATGVTTSIEALGFSPVRGHESPPRGWAVGSGGTILTTSDGGRTWSPQRQGEQRAALLVLCSEPAAAPLELLRRYAAGESYRVVVVPLVAGEGEVGSIDAANNRLGRGSIDNVNSSQGADRHRLHEAISACGADLAAPLWRGPLLNLSTAVTVEELWDELHRQSDGQARQQLIQRLVQAIRTWRPEVLLQPHASDPAHSAANRLLVDLVSEACVTAADSTQEIELTLQLGLPAWPLKRLVTLHSPATRGTIRIANDEFHSSLGCSPAEGTTAARGLLFRSATVSEPLTTLDVAWQQPGLPTSSRDLFAGLHLPHGSLARRPPVLADAQDLDRLRRLTQKRQQLVRLLDHTVGSSVWLSQVVNLTGGLDHETGGQLLWQLADGYRQTGHLPMAADTLYLLVRRYPQHPLTEGALVWLVQYYASGEQAHLTGQQQAVQQRTMPLGNMLSAEAEPEELPPKADPNLLAEQRFEQALQLGEYLKQTRPALYAEPSLRFPLAVAARRQGFATTAEKYFLFVDKGNLDPAWQRAARAERWLTEPTQLPPEKPVAVCRLEHSPPHLDGQLDEPLWQRAESLTLRQGTRPTEGGVLKLARDQEFFYLAMDCPRQKGSTYEPDQQARSRDAQLQAYDRVELALDLDRDYQTAFEFTVDYRGYTCDACWGDRSWQPTWYVASHLTPERWKIEAAIPWRTMTTQQPALLEAWALRAVRRTPVRGSPATVSSWTGVSAATPDSFGLLLFK